MGRKKEEVADAYFPVLPMREGGAVVGLQCGRGYSLDLLQPHLTESNEITKKALRTTSVEFIAQLFKLKMCSSPLLLISPACLR